MKVAILILLGAAYIFNSIALAWAYPDASKTVEAYYSFVAARNVVYEWMFALFFMLSYLLSDKIMKAISCFFMVLAFSSVVDKCFFGITEYLKSDIILVIISSILSCYVYVRECKR